MRTTKYPLFTLKEIPSDAEMISHQLMLRAGLIRKLAAGLYTWLPTGLRVLKKVEAIVREEMGRIGAIELLMPMIQPAAIWQESGRLEQYGAELLRFKDRNNRDFVVGPTHEEVITYLLRNEVSSYKHLPLNVYQIQTKFRDEIRPRFGIVRAREFMMKDGYSFHIDKASLEQTYSLMYDAYCNIFRRLGLDFRVVEADSGSIGGQCSHEFQILTDNGEDKIVFSTESSYAANIEMAEAFVANESQLEPPTRALELIDTPDVKSIDDLVVQYNIPVERTIKTLVVKGNSSSVNPLVALIVRGDHMLNNIKAEQLVQVASPLEFASEKEIRTAVGAGPGSLGPINLPIPMIIDRHVAVMSDFAAGANIDNRHYVNINWHRDLPMPDIATISRVEDGDRSPDGKGVLRIKHGIEVGHIFQLGNKYSAAMNAVVQDEDGRNREMEMGCYGIGISRIVAAAIEQHHDDVGIVWPTSMAPFHVVIIPINMYKSTQVLEASERLYAELAAAGIDVLFDDRKERPGVMFADAELIGIPHVVIIGERNLNSGQLEYRSRKKEHNMMINQDKIVQYLIDQRKEEARCH